MQAGADDRALGRAWHTPNAPAITLREFARILGEEAGVNPRLRTLPRPVTRALLPLIGLAVPTVRGLHENLYIMYEPYIVDNGAYTKTFGDHATPLRQAISETIDWYRQRKMAMSDAPLRSVA